VSVALDLTLPTTCSEKDRQTQLAELSHIMPLQISPKPEVLKIP